MWTATRRRAGRLGNAMHARLMRAVVSRTATAMLAALALVSCAGPKLKEPQLPPPVVIETPPPNLSRELPPPFLPDVPDRRADGNENDEVKPSRSLRVEQSGEDKFVILNFEDAEIRTVIETIGDLLNINYILAPGISGKVTIQSYRKFPVKDLFSVFQSVLELNNLTAVVEGEFYKIIPIADAKTEAIDVGKGKEVQLTLESAFVNQIVPVQFVKATDAAAVLKNFMPKGADLTVYEPTNLLIITARPSALRRLMKLLEAVDIDETQQESVQTFVYYAEHGEAKKLAEVLKTLYGKASSATPTPRTTRQPASRATQTRPTRRVTAAGPPAAQTPATGTSVGGEVAEGDILITAYEEINAILIKTTPRTYLAMVDALKKIDVPRKQVLIEVMVAEITLGEEDKYGVEWMLRGVGTSPFVTFGVNGGSSGVHVDGTGEDGLGNPVLTTGDGSISPSGGFATIFEPGRISAVVNAFASADRLNVVASPHILTTDNEEARIEVGQEVPTASGSTTTQPITGGATTTGSTVTTGQIQYRTTGTILEVTPQISEKNQVLLKVSQEISSVFSETTGGIISPTFNQRKAKTTAIVQSGHTLVIGGLIREQKDRSKAGLPFLSKIPVLGLLFGTTSYATDRTELLILVTPHVVSSVEEADRITSDFQDRVRTVRTRIEDYKADRNE